jgi:hypothetical protein
MHEKIRQRKVEKSVKPPKEMTRDFLRECVTPGTEAHEYYKRNDWFSISTAILDFTNAIHVPLLPRKCDPYERLDDLLEEFKYNYSSGNNFEESSEKILESFTWPEQLTECVYTRLPAVTEVSHDDDMESIIDELNKTPVHLFAEIERHLLGPDVSIALMCKRPVGNKKIDPLNAIEAFLLAYQNGLYPPVWVLDYMADIFKTFHDSLGMKSLDKLFGFKKGRGGPFQKSLEEERDEILCLNIARLEHFFGIDRETACKLEAERWYNNKDFNKTPLKFDVNLSWRTLEDKYRKKWATIFNFGEKDREWSQKWLKDHGQEFLNHYPSLRKRKILK